MSLVTRVSIAFLVALALALGGFSACLYYVAGLRLRLALDQELEATLDHFPERAEVETGRVSWAIYDEGRRVETAPGAGRTMILDNRDLGPLAVDVATTIQGSDGLRWRILRGNSAADIRLRRRVDRTRPRARIITDTRRVTSARRAAGPRSAVAGARRVGVVGAGGGRDPMAGSRFTADLAWLVGADRRDRSSLRPPRPRAADPLGGVGPRDAL